MSLIESLRNPSPIRQVALAAAAALVISGILIFLYVAYLHHPYKPLFTRLRPADAAAIVASLQKEKAPYRLSDGGSTILVPDNRVDETRLDLMNQDLALKGAVGFELFNKSDMGLTEFAQKINYQRALQGELARTIMSLDSIEAARVHLSLPDPSIFRDDKRAPKASITITPREGQSLSAATVHGVRRLVAAAVPDLDIENVVVLDDHGDVVGGDDAATHPPSPPLQRAQAIEAFYEARVRQALYSRYPSADVRVSAPLAISAAPGAGPAAEAFEDWAPTRRRFPLTVDIEVTAPLAPGEEAAIKALAARALGEASNPEDELLVGVAPPDPGAAPAPGGVGAAPGLAAASRPVTASFPAAKPAAASKLALVILAAILAPLLFAAGFLARRGVGGTRPLTEVERTRYAARLRRILSEVDGDAATQA